MGKRCHFPLVQAVFFKITLVALHIDKEVCYTISEIGFVCQNSLNYHLLRFYVLVCVFVWFFFFLPVSCSLKEICLNVKAEIEHVLNLCFGNTVKLSVILINVALVSGTQLFFQTEFGKSVGCAEPRICNFFYVNKQFVQ